ncbi:hypothetical protein [Fibrella aquatilis]|uniref:Uncharacterized protein n=1 Tax=Fibrella aquatilis TaxID=2817059 RepID=A0A939G381_9BACT|nr:hypothetical protein [Fibrella aquatilis]MBO0930373.1 hypothetical protein [Fibrella aquatilis]
MAQDAVYIAQLQNCQLYDGVANPDVAYSQACKQVQTLVSQINEVYQGSSTADRLAFLKRRRGLLIARAAVIQGAMAELGATDARDRTALTISGLGGAVQQLFSVIPGIGGAIGTFVGLGAQLIAGAFDNTAANEAAKIAELNKLQTDFTGLQVLVNDHTAEIGRLSLPYYVLYGAAGLVLLAVLYTFFRRQA